jgi:3-hydroxyacyl-CoA dehydrogenase
MANVKSIGIIGAGQMGGGIAHVAALSGFDVILLDVSSELTEKGIAIMIETGESKRSGRRTSICCVLR